MQQRYGVVCCTFFNYWTCISTTCLFVQAIPSHTERRSIFEHYVRTRADVERREKRAAQKAAIEGFKQLLEEASQVFLGTKCYFSFFPRLV